VSCDVTVLCAFDDCSVLSCLGIPGPVPACDHSYHFLAVNRPHGAVSVHTGGIFTLRLQFPDQYPDKPPRVRFTCDMFHPNGGSFFIRLCVCDARASCLARSLAVFSDGSLCLDIIQDMWKPIYTVGMLLTSIQVRTHVHLLSRFPLLCTPCYCITQSLLSDPNCNSPANLDAAQVCLALGPHMDAIDKIVTVCGCVCGCEFGSC
jgi:ubiquitin-protein ligase